MCEGFEVGLGRWVSPLGIQQAVHHGQVVRGLDVHKHESVPPLIRRPMAAQIEPWKFRWDRYRRASPGVQQWTIGEV